MIIVTGGAGFIGSNLVFGLNRRGARDVVVCDWLEDGDKWRNLAKREIADIVSPDALEDYLSAHGQKVEAIFHLGAISDTTASDGDLVLATNFKLPLFLWQWCALHRVPFIYASSAATYGDGTAGFDDDNTLEALARLKPLNLYGWSKHLFDRRIVSLYRNSGQTPPQWVGLKFFNVFGPNEEHKGHMKSVVAQLYPAAKEGKPARLFRSHHPDYADGGQMRDFIHVDDCVDVMLWLMDTPEVSGIFNLGTGKARSFHDLAAAVYQAVGSKFEIDFIDTPAAIRDKYQYFTEARMDRLRQAGYGRPFTSLEEGVASYVGGYLMAADPYR